MFTHVSKTYYEGQELPIYLDLIKKDFIEGVAVLITCFIRNRDQECWQVSFVDRPSEIHFRWLSNG